MLNAMESFLEEFLERIAHERRGSEHTLRSYRRHLSEFLCFIKARQERPSTVDDFDLPLIRSYLASLFENNSASTISHKLSCIRSFGRFLVRSGVRSDNPAKLVASPKLPKLLPRFLDVDDTFRLMEAPKNLSPDGLRDRAMLEVLYGSGLRVSELCGLNLEHLDLTQKMVWIRH